MKFSKEQVIGFVEAALGWEALVTNSDPPSYVEHAPRLRAWFNGAAPVTLYDGAIVAALRETPWSGEIIPSEQRMALADVLEAVVDVLRGTKPVKESLPYVILAGEPRTPIARFEYADQARNWAEEKYAGRYEFVAESEAVQ
jgi:hypothetical protein